MEPQASASLTVHVGTQAPAPRPPRATRSSARRAARDSLRVHGYRPLLQRNRAHPARQTRMGARQHTWTVRAGLPDRRPGHCDGPARRGSRWRRSPRSPTRGCAAASFPRPWSPNFISSATTRGRTPASPESCPGRRAPARGQGEAARGSRRHLTDSNRSGKPRAWTLGRRYNARTCPRSPICNQKSGRQSGDDEGSRSYLHFVGLQLVRLHFAASAEIQVPSGGVPKSRSYISSVSP